MYYAAGDHDGSSRALAVYMADLIGDEVFGHADAVSKAVFSAFVQRTRRASHTTAFCEPLSEQMSVKRSCPNWALHERWIWRHQDSGPR